MTDSVLPVFAGLAVGVLFVVLLGMTLRLDNTLSDAELIAKYSKLPEMRYFLEKHPDAKTEVQRLVDVQAILVSFSVEKQIQPASAFNSGINVLTVDAYEDKLSRLTLSVSCGSQGFTVGGGIADISNINETEERCFSSFGQNDNDSIFEPETSGDELNDDVYQLSIRP